MVALPVRLRDAASWSAQFLVPARAARAIAGPGLLEAAQPVAGRAAAVLGFASYREGDLGPTTSSRSRCSSGSPERPRVHCREAARVRPWKRRRVRARPPSAKSCPPRPAARSSASRASSRTFPSPGSAAAPSATSATRVAGFSPSRCGKAVPSGSADPNLPNYSLRDGVLHASEWIQEGVVRMRLGGTRLELGSHLVAEDLRSLGLPKRGLVSSTMHGLRGMLGSVAEVEATHPEPGAL